MCCSNSKTIKVLAERQVRVEENSRPELSGFDSAKITFTIDGEGDVGTKVRLQYDEDVDQDFLEYVTTIMAGMYGLITASLTDDNQLENLIKMGEIVRQKSDFDSKFAQSIVDNTDDSDELDAQDAQDEPTATKVKYLI